MAKNLEEIFKGFSKLSLEQRHKALLKAGCLTEEDSVYLKKGGLQSLALGEKFIENVIGYFQLPMGVATNFRIDGVDYMIPMAVEETSIVAAASKTARWVRECGAIRTEVIGQDIIGQIQFSHVANAEKFKAAILTQKNFLIEVANRDVAFGMVSRGGGVKDIQVRFIDRGEQTLEGSTGSGFMGVVHVLMDPVDAMGANVINQVCEYLKEPLERFTGEKVTMCILSNLVDTKVTRAEVVLNNIEEDLALRIQEASLFAEQDPYRAATNNKGVLNGIDPILIATGNDWRAVEAGVHAYAARTGQYRSITKWRKAGSSLVGTFAAPLIVGTVGGVTALHPTAKLAMRMMDIQNAVHLSRICAAVGLVQNLGALKALTTVGIIEGHMKLHIRNLSLGAGAQELEMPVLQKKLEEILQLRKRISLSNAIEALTEIRANKKTESEMTHP